MEKELMLKIVERALEINSRQKNTIFINYFGHVDSLGIQIHTKGWKEGQKPDYSKNVYMGIQSPENDKKELQEILNKLDKIKELSSTNQSEDSSND